MAKPKIDRVKLDQMLRDGKPQKEIAHFFGVSEGAISKAKIELKTAVIKNIALESAHKVVIGNLDTVSQLRKINETANQILDGLMEEILKGKASREKQKDLREIALKASQEIRGQLSLQLEIMRALYDVTAVAEFQKEVITVIGDANKSPCCEAPVICSKCGKPIDLRAVIIENLKRARALRSGVTFRP